jgi:hypothetical protein
VDDLVVTGTAAEIPAQVLANLSRGWVRVFIQQGHRRQDHAWCAESALNGVVIDKGLLQRVKVSFFAQPFNGGNLSAGSF